MAFTQDFRTQRRNYNDGEIRIGEKDRLWYDSNTNSIRIGDGETPGGVIVGGSGGGSDYVLPTASTSVKGGVKVDGTTITISNGIISATQQDLSSYATQSYVTTRGYLTSVGTISYNDLSNKPTLFSGSYTDLTNKPTLFDGAYSSLSGTPTIPSNTNQLTNGAGFITTADLPSLTGYATLTGEETLTNKTLTSPTITGGVFEDTFTIGNQVFYDHGYNGFSVNEDWDIVGEGNFTGYHYTSGADRDGVAFTLARTGQFTTGFGIHGTSSSNEYVIGSETANTDFVFKSSIGMPFDVSGGVEIFRISKTGVLTVVQNENTETVATESFVTGQGYITSTDQILWVNPNPTPQTLWRNSVTANSTGATISLISGLPGLGSEVTWTFDEDKIKFPDNTEQTTAFTGSIAYASVTGTPTLATVATSGSYSDLSNKPTTVTVNGTSITLGSSGTVTAAAGTLTGTTLNSSVVSSSLTSVGTLTSLTSSGLVRFNSDGVGASYNAVSNSVNIGGVLGVASNIYTNGNIDIVAGSAYYIGGNNVLNGTTLGSNIVNSSLTSVGTLTSLTSTGSVTANHTTAFIAGDNAISNVALQIPREGAIRNLYNGAANNMYFDVSTGGTSQGQFQFRSSSAFTNILTMSPTAFNVNTDAVVTARTPSFGRLPWNSAIDTELTIDDYRFRINNNAGSIYPQIISNVSGQTRNSAWTSVAAISGQSVGQGGSTGNLVPNNAWTNLYTFGSMNSAGDTVTTTLQDKQNGRIYRITFMRSDNGATTGYNIIAERLL